MSEATARALSSNRKKRGVVRASITRLCTRLAELENSPDLELARSLNTRLQTLDAEYKVHHYATIELLEDEDALEKEQETLDDHDDCVIQLTTRLERLIATCSSTNSSQPKIAFKCLKHLEKALSTIFGNISSIHSDDDDRLCLLRQYEEQLSEFKAEFSDIRRSLLSLDVEDGDLSQLQVQIEKSIFDCSLEIKKLLRSQVPLVSTTTDLNGVKLPKLDVPTFNGNILNWKTFWEQFNISVHGRSNLSDSEKLAYLRHALKGGSAKNVIESLTRSGEHYSEAVACLKSRYNRPHLIHQAHIRKILEMPNLKDGNGKELRRLHDAAQQHLRALKALGYEPSGSFITWLLELKLDINTMFEWQRHSQASADVPHYQQLLDFINLRAQASKASVSNGGKKSLSAVSSTKKSIVPPKPVASFAASTDTSSYCMLCKSSKHPLYVCSKFKSLSHSDKLSTLRSNNLCINCMRPGHFVRNCKSLHRCIVCQRPHHTLLHVEEKESVPPPADTAPDLHT